MSEMSYLEAVGRAQGEAMEEDPNVVLIGEDVRSNLFGTAPGFVERFGSNRVWDAPLSEEGFTGLATGAAMTGLRPIVDLTYASFLYLAFDQIINQAAKSRYMFGGQTAVPVTYRASMFYGASMAAHHSDRPYAMLMSVPGLTVLLPATPADAYGLLRSAVASNDPVIVFEDATLWLRKGDVPDRPFRIPIGKAQRLGAGTDVTLVALAGSVVPAMEARDRLEGEGISVDLIDPRTLVPLDTGSIMESIRTTRRLVVAEPGPRTGGAAAEIMAMACEEAFGDLLSPPRRVTAPDIQIPFSPSMEKGLYPDGERIADTVRHVVAGKPEAGQA